ncbi:MAG: hypothetical protein AAB736_01130 [Patescibacteria group bacterium]
MSRRKGFRLFEQNSAKTLNSDFEIREEIIFQESVEKYAGKRNESPARMDRSGIEEEQNY